MSVRGLKSYLRRIGWQPKSREPNGKAARDAPQPAWHAMTAEQAADHLATSREGLPLEEAALRLKHYGANALPAAAGKSALRRFFAQFDDVLIYVLLASAVVTALLRHGVDTAVILFVVLLNAIIGFIQEGRAEKALEAIRKMISPKASVLREGGRLTVNAADLVPGDLLILEPGDRVTADVRLTKARNLRIDEAALTGESVARDGLLGNAGNSGAGNRHRGRDRSGERAWPHQPDARPRRTTGDAAHPADECICQATDSGHPRAVCCDRGLRSFGA